MNSLQDKRILIVGGSSGIGLAVAKAAAERGAEIITASRGKPEKLSFPHIKFDICNQDDYHGLFSESGSIDHLVISVRPELSPSPFTELDIAAAMKAFETKFWGQLRLIRTAIPYISPSGSIVMTSGIAGEKTYKASSVMGCINSAVESLCRSLALELAPLRVNVVSPGFTESKSQKIMDYAKNFPVARLAEAQEIASEYIHLMESAYLTGTVSVVDGGARLI